MDKEKTLYFTYYDHETLKDDIKKLLDNKDLWKELEDNREKLQTIEIVINNYKKDERMKK